MRITVFGASGKVGRLVVHRLLNDGHDVTAFVFGTSPFEENPGLKVITGDVHNLEDVMPAVKEAEAVLSTLGSWGTKQKDILSSGTKNIVTAMQQHNVTRVVTLTGADAVSSTDKPTFFDRLFHALLKLSPARKILADGEQHIELLSRSSLNWTVLRSPIMNERGDTKQYKITLHKPKLWETIHRHSVANAMVDLISDSTYDKTAPYICRTK